MEQFFSREQTADQLSVSTQTIDRLIESGKLACVRVGKRRVAIPASSLAAYVEKCMSNHIAKELNDE
jgi:excisionase family DNA binding protein